VPQEFVDEEAQRFHAMAMAFMASRGGRGEPFKSFFEPGQLAEQVQKLGFADVSDLGPKGGSGALFYRPHGRPSASG